MKRQKLIAFALTSTALTTADPVITTTEFKIPETEKETFFQKIAGKIASPFNKVQGTIITDFLGDKMETSQYAKHKKMYKKHAEDLGTTYNYSRKEHNSHRHSNDFNSSSLKTLRNIQEKLASENHFRESMTEITAEKRMSYKEAINFVSGNRNSRRPHIGPSF